MGRLGRVISGVELKVASCGGGLLSRRLPRSVEGFKLTFASLCGGLLRWP